MKTKFILFCMMFCSFSYAQEIERPLSSAAFDSLVIGDLNFMVLGDDNIKQGLSYEYKEDNTELTLSGNLWSKNGFIMTLDGKFAVESGAFIFDKDDGSKKGKLNLNLFITGFGILNSKYYSISKNNNVNDIDTQRAMLKNDFDRVTLSDSVYKNIMIYESIARMMKIPCVSANHPDYRKQRVSLNNSHLVAFDYNLANFEAVQGNVDEILAVIKKKYYDGLTSTTLSGAKGELSGLVDRVHKKITIVENGADVILHDNTYSKKVKVAAFLKDYAKVYDKFVNFRSENNKMEIANFKKFWTAEKSNYFGISPFYERQGFDIYTPTTDISVAFKDRFKEIRSDLFGVNFSYNFIYVSRKKSFIILRLLNSVGRSNNFGEYSKKDYSFTTNVSDINGSPIQVTEKKTGYSNDKSRSYEYGMCTQTNFEAYLSFPVAGVYGKIGYSNNDALLDRETYPLEAGVIINLKSKDKKNIVAVQLFMSRQNLNTHPDEDMNFGLKVGLPINLRRN